MESNESTSDVRYTEVESVQPSRTIITTQIPESPQAALSPNLPRRVLGEITSNIVLILGVALVLVILFTFILSWVDKVMPESILVMAGVALGYLGNAITNNNQG